MPGKQKPERKFEVGGTAEAIPERWTEVNAMKQILVVLALLCITFPMLAQKNTEFRTGHLAKIEEVFIPVEAGRTNYKANYLIRLRDGSAETVALYRVTIFGRDYVKPLKKDTDMPYRISGKHLFLKSPEGHEIKALLCEVKSNCTLCGSDSLCSAPE